MDIGIDDDLDGRLGTEELVELGDDTRSELAPPDEDDATFGVAVVGEMILDLELLRVNGLTDDERAVVGGDADQFITDGQQPVGRGVEDDVPVCSHQSQEAALLEHQMCCTEAGADEFGEHLEVDLVTIEVEEFTKDLAQAALATGLSGEFSDHGVGVHDQNLLIEQCTNGDRCVLADQFGDDRHTRLRTEVTQREQRLDGGCIVAPDHHDAACSGHVDQCEIGECRRVTTAAHELRGAEVADRIPQRLFHRHLVLVRQHDDRRSLEAFVREHQLADDGGHALGPPEDEGVAVFEDGAASFAKCFDALIDRARDETDEAAGDEDAGEGDEQPQDPRPPTAVTGERPGVDDSQHRLPEGLTER